MDEIKAFKKEVVDRINGYTDKKSLQHHAHEFMKQSILEKYSYNFSWLGRPIIQYPQDIVALQEIIWSTQPDLIIETGIAHGGSIIFSASMLKLIKNEGLVLGIDIDIRSHNRKEIENHFLFKQGWIEMIEGSSIDDEIIREVSKKITKFNKVMVILDSNHTHDHVYQELQKYSSFVSKGCYLVVMDSMVEDFENELFDDKNWGKGNNPKTAVHQFLKENDQFEIDESIFKKLMISVAPDGYLKRK